MLEVSQFIFFFSIGTWHPIREIYPNLFIHLAIIEEFLAIMNKVLNVQVQIFMGTYILISWGKCLGIQLPGHGECMLRFIRSFQTVFQSVSGIFVVLTETYSSPSGSKSLSTLSRVNLFNFSYFSGCIVIFLCGFTLDHPEHFFHELVGTPLYIYFCNGTIQIFCLLFIKCSCFIIEL